MVKTGRDAVMEIPVLKWPEIKRARFRYLGNDSGHKVDWLTVLFVEHCPAVYAAVDDDLGIRYDPETGNVAGVEIKGFEDSFLCQQLPDLAVEWAALKPDAPDGIHSSGWLSSKAAILLACSLQEVVKRAANGPDWLARQSQSKAEYEQYVDFILDSRTAEPPALKWPEIRQVMYWYTGEVYDDEDREVAPLLVDSLMVLFVENRDAINADVGEHGEMMIRYDTGTGDVIGLEIELFEYHFLKQHSELADGWAALKPAGEGGIHNSPWLTDGAALGYACLLKDLAYQGTLAPGWPHVDKGDILLWSKYGVPV